MTATQFVSKSARRVKKYLSMVVGPEGPRSVSRAYFDHLYDVHSDPFNYETSDYEAKKYAHTLSALPRLQYRSALEIGGSIGVLTARLASRCESLLSIDVCEKAQAKARRRCAGFPNVEIQLMQVPRQFPRRSFDLTVFSEVGYYLSMKDLIATRQHILNHLEPGGHLLLVHWSGQTRIMPLNNAQVHGCFMEEEGKLLRHISGSDESGYRIDLLEKI
jgi:predicted TPR repeat methyltransferase